MSARVLLDGATAWAGRPHAPAGPGIDGVTLAIGAGWTAIVGPNGAGKSTLLRTAAGLVVPTAGSARLEVDGVARPLTAIAPRERGRRIAWLGQRAEAPAELAAHDVVALGRLPHMGLLGAGTDADRRAVARALDEAGCTAWADRRLGDLSGGEQQRVLLARALAVEAPVLLLDEPTTHLDPPQQGALVTLARRLAVQGVAVATVLHDLGLALLADRVVVLARGRVVADAAPVDATLHAALVGVFDGAIAVAWHEGRPIVVPRPTP